MHSEINKAYKRYEKDLQRFVEDFSTEGTLFFKKRRNILKLFTLGNEKIVGKSYRIPNIVNNVVYRHFRKSKAQRAYEYALLLNERGIGSPASVAYFQENKGLVLGRSYYFCLYQEHDYTFQDLIDDRKLPNWEKILRQFTHFTYKLHENGFEFLDHGPGNTLIKKIGESNYAFYLVDTNQMNFHENMEYETRIKNFSKLTVSKSIFFVLADEYAKLIDRDPKEVYADLCRIAQKRQNKRKWKHTIKLSALKRLIKGEKKTDFYTLLD